MIYLLIGIVILGVIAALISYFRPKKDNEDEINLEVPEGCCGEHATCIRDSLLAGANPKIIYYEDEELDRFAYKNAEDYIEEEIDEFREVLDTMQQADVPGWMRSLTMRNIELPTELRAEVLLLTNDIRERRKIDKNSI